MPEPKQPERLAPRATSNRNGGRDRIGTPGRDRRNQQGLSIEGFEGVTAPPDRISSCPARRLHADYSPIHVGMQSDRDRELSEPESGGRGWAAQWRSRFLETVPYRGAPVVPQLFWGTPREGIKPISR